MSTQHPISDNYDLWKLSNPEDESPAPLEKPDPLSVVKSEMETVNNALGGQAEVDVQNGEMPGVFEWTLCGFLMCSEPRESATTFLCELEALCERLRESIGD